MPGPFLQDTAIPTPRRGRYGWREVIAGLDPERDCQQIHRITVGYEFPWDCLRSMEFALFRTYCSPSISQLLRQTGEFERRPQKRYDDTSLLMAEMIEHGYDSSRGRDALRTVNRMHGKYEISNDDMLYVLSTFIYDPIDWIDRYGWRRLHPNERLAFFHFYRGVGVRMGVKDIPASYTEYMRFKLDYEREHFRYSEDNARIGRYTLELFCAWFPRPLRPFVARGIYAMIDERMSVAFGFPPGSARLRVTAESVLRARATAERYLPKRRRSKTTQDPRNRTYPGYPKGYRPSDLGVHAPEEAGPGGRTVGR